MTAKERQGWGAGAGSGPSLAGVEGQEMSGLFPESPQGRGGVGNSSQKATAEGSYARRGSWFRGRLQLQLNVAMATGGLTPTRPPAARSQQGLLLPGGGGEEVGRCGSPTRLAQASGRGPAPQHTSPATSRGTLTACLVLSQGAQKTGYRGPLLQEPLSEEKARQG